MKHQIVIVGGGSAGIAVSATLLRKDKSLDIAIIEPADTHYYQPAFTLVGGGEFNPGDTHQPESKLIPKGAAWVQDAVAS
ncbi:MAG: pyridine nucleotide-disulfide oxidoreductase, partial [Methylococcales bacterium]